MASVGRRKGKIDYKAMATGRQVKEVTTTPPPSSLAELEDFIAENDRLQTSLRQSIESTPTAEITYTPAEYREFDSEPELVSGSETEGEHTEDEILRLRKEVEAAQKLKEEEKRKEEKKRRARRPERERLRQQLKKLQESSSESDEEFQFQSDYRGETPKSQKRQVRFAANRPGPDEIRAALRLEKQRK